MERREALRMLMATTTLPFLEGFSPSELLRAGMDIHHGASERDALAPYLVLSKAQGALVTAAAERIIPRTDTPGAGSAGVDGFVDTMLARWYSNAERDRLLAGLGELEARAQAQCQRSFVRCSLDDQDHILQGFDDVVTSMRRQAAMSGASRDMPSIKPDEHWFAMFKYLTIWGYYTSKAGMTEELGSFPMPGRYDGNARRKRVRPTSGPDGR